MYTKFDEIKAVLGIFEKYLKRVKDEYDEHYDEVKNAVNSNIKPDDVDKISEFYLSSSLLAEDSNEYTLTCSKKNSETDYIFDYVYTVKYKGVAYQMTYEIKSTDLSIITDQEEYDRKSAALSTFVDSKFLYLDNALNMEGSYLETNDDGTFKQTIDLNKVTKNEINEIEEVMFFEIDDSINLIRTKFENNDYVCE